MAVKRISERCTVKHSEVCKFLGCDGCEDCTLYKSNVREFEKQKTSEIWDVTREYLAEDIDQVHNSDTCLYCKKRPGKKKIGYGSVDIAHPEPAHERGAFFGMGNPTRMPVGSMLQMPVAMCEDCKKKYFWVDNLKFFGLVIGFIVGIIITLLIQNTQFVQRVSEAAIGILIIAMGIGWVIGKWCSGIYKRKTQDAVYYRLFEIPELHEMEELGWFELNPPKDKTRIFFLKKKPRKNFVFHSHEVFEEAEDGEVTEEKAKQEDETATI